MKSLMVLLAFTALQGGEPEPIVVELFTSQGCSSCPPADRLLAELAERDDVLALSFHVDYWDYLGWPDPYADAAFTQRQRSYDRALGSRTYTPQMIVDGEAEFVGSDRAKAQRAIRSASEKETRTRLTVDIPDWKPDRVRIAYALEDPPDKAIVNLAVVQQSTDNQVNAGENRGRRLTHRNVVRSFVQSRKQAGTLEARLPKEVDRESLRLVIYVQDAQNMAVATAREVR